MKFSPLLSRFTLLLLLAFPAMALAAEEVRFASTAEVEVQEINAKGEKVLVRKPASLVIPGTVVIYTNSFTNVGDKPAERLVITNPTPKGTEYLEGTATGKNAAVTFSVDGGNRFDVPDKLVIVGQDGKPRRAEAREYTHIRWTLATPLPPGGEGAVAFRTKLQ